jgi:hypothetical protein
VEISGQTGATYVVALADIGKVIRCDGSNGKTILGDADAWALIFDLRTAGATVPLAKALIIDTGIVAEKTASRWTLLRRWYMPIWGIAAANAICWKSRTSGTFVGNVTHPAGYVATSAPTGHFIGSSTPGSLGLTHDNASIFSVGLAGDQDFMGCGGASNSRLLVGKVASNRRASIPSTASAVGSGTDLMGFLMASRVGSTTKLYQRKQSGWLTPASVTTTDTTVLPAFAPSFLGNFNAIGTVTTDRTNASQFATYGFGLGFTDAEAEAFSAALKTTWETLTGLALP